MAKKQPNPVKTLGLDDFTPEQKAKLLAMLSKDNDSKPELTPEESRKQQRISSLAKARTVMQANAAKRRAIKEEVAKSPPARASKGTKTVESEVLPVSPPALPVPKPSLKERIFGKKAAKVALVPTLVVTRTTIGDGIRYIPEDKLPPDAFKMLYKGSWIYPLVEVSDPAKNGKGEHTYIPWPLMDATDDAEGDMPPEELGMATYWPEAKAYYVQGSSGTNKLHIGLLVAIVIGLFLLIFLIFTVGLGN